MSADIIKRDQNFRTVGGAVTNDANQDVTMLRTDPTTKYLLCENISGSPTAANSVQIAKRDQNHRPVCLAWDDTNKVLQEVLTDEHGYLLVDIIIIP